MSDDVNPQTSGETVQWCPNGAPMDGIPGQVVRLLADDSKTYGYGYGPGWSMGFGHAGGDIYVEPRQWVTRYPDGRVTVTDERPANAKEPADV